MTHEPQVIQPIADMPVPNFRKRTVYQGDCLEVMRGLNSGTIDLIATDPPFGKDRNFMSTPGDMKGNESSIGLTDRWRWIDLQDGSVRDLTQSSDSRLWELIGVIDRNVGETMAAFATFIAVRAAEMRRLLKPDGTLYWHCDYKASHYVKAVLDVIFGESNFVDEVVWFKGSRGTRRSTGFQREHETIFRYSKSSVPTWNTIIGEYRERSLKRYNQVDDDGRSYALIKRYRPNGEAYYGKTYPEGKKQGDVVDIPTLASRAKERTGYPTQKPLELYRLLIEASSNPGDWVLDPFCGCATTLDAAEQLGRNWIGIDTWDGAIREVHKRLGNKKARREKNVPVRTDEGEIAINRVLPLETNAGTDSSKELPRGQLKREKLRGRSIAMCWTCELHFPADELTIDHDPPRSLGGRNIHHETELLCEPCNREKGDDKTREALRLEKRRVRGAAVGLDAPGLLNGR